MDPVCVLWDSSRAAARASRSRAPGRSPLSLQGPAGEVECFRLAGLNSQHLFRLRQRQVWLAQVQMVASQSEPSPLLQPLVAEWLRQQLLQPGQLLARLGLQPGIGVEQQEEGAAEAPIQSLLQACRRLGGSPLTGQQARQGHIRRREVGNIGQQAPVGLGGRLGIPQPLVHERLHIAKPGGIGVVNQSLRQRLLGLLVKRALDQCPRQIHLMKLAMGILPDRTSEVVQQGLRRQ